MIDKKLLQPIEHSVGYYFRDKNLLLEAITHPSFASSNSKHYERLEFLGDAVLNLVIAEILFSMHKQFLEDKLSSMRAKLVSSEAICLVASRIGIQHYVIMSSGEENNGGRQNNRNIENAMEAIIAAVYLDGGIEEVKKIIGNLWQDIISDPSKLAQDSKTLLQEWAQKYKHITPIYATLSQTGLSHCPVFEVEVTVGSDYKARGSGTNKKFAEKSAASNFLDKYKINH